MTAELNLTPEQRRALDLPLDTPADPVGGVRSTWIRWQAWAYRHRVSLAIVVPLVLVTVAVRLWGIGHGPALADDEGTYVAQAWAVQVKHTLAPYTYWYDHPPFGWIQIALFTWIGGTFSGHGLSVVAVRHLMVGYAAVDAALLYLLGRRLGVRRLPAAAAVLLWALSPLAVGYSRMVYLDNLALPWLLAAFVCAATRRRSMWSQVAAGICFAGAVLSKETMILLLPALLVVAYQHTERRTRAFCLAGLATAGVLVLAIYPLLAILRGELIPGRGHVSLLQSLGWQFFSRPSTGSALVGGSASRALLDSWISLDGWLLLLGLVGAAGCAFVRRLRPVTVAVAVLVAAGLRPGYLPQPYVIALLPFAGLAIAAAVDAGWTALRDRPPVPVRPGAVAEQRRRRLGRVALAGGSACVAVLLVPAWAHGDATLAGPNQSAPVAQAEHWLDSHARASIAGQPNGRVGHDVLVDDTMWTDLVTAGFPQQHVIWFYKLDYVDNLDPSVRRRVRSWTDFEYVVDSDIIRTSLRQNSSQTYTIARQAIAHSTVVAKFGTGSGQILIRRVDHSTGRNPK